MFTSLKREDLEQYFESIYVPLRRENGSDDENEAGDEEGPEIEYYAFEKIKQKIPKILSKFSSTYFKPVKKKKLF
jgi:hypothetical protein